MKLLAWIIKLELRKDYKLFREPGRQLQPALRVKNTSHPRPEKVLKLDKFQERERIKLWEYGVTFHIKKRNISLYIVVSLLLKIVRVCISFFMAFPSSFE